MNTNRPYECTGVTPAMLTRRDLLKTVSAGFGWLAFSGLASAESKSPLAPRGKIKMTHVAEDLITDSLFKAIRADTIAVFFFGEIRYIDVFGKYQTTCFRLKCGIAQNGAAKIEVCSEGNYAT